MAFPIDQFMSPPPAANTKSRPQADEYAKGDNAQVRQTESRRDLDTRGANITDRDRSDFQRHLNDEADARASQQAEDTHGNNVSQVARTTEVPDTVESPDEPVAQAGKGMAVKAVASDKTKSSADNQIDVETEADSPASLKVDPANTESGARPASINVTTTGDPVGDQPPAVGKTETPDISAPAGSTSEPTQPVPAETTTDEEGNDGTVQVTVRQDGLVDTAADVATKTTDALPASDDGAAPVETAVGTRPESVSTTPAPHHNENAQKVEGSERPGWGAEHAPRSDRGTQARDLKSGNADKESLSGSTTQAKTTASTTPAVKIESEAEAPVPATSAADDTIISEAVAPEQAIPTTETKPNLTEPLAVAITAAGENPALKSDTPETKGLSATPDKSAAAAPASPDTANKSAAPQPADKQAANLTAPANPQAPVNPQAEASADANAALNASPTGVAKALASGQGKMPMASTPTAEEATLALAGTDKRGTRTGAKATDAPGDIVSASKGKNAKAEGNAQSAFEPGQHKSNTGPANQAAQAHASAATANSQAASGSAQGTMPQVMPDLAALTNTADMSLPRGNATMEIDPMTGALHLSGTGSAKTSAPNLSEVTMQFSRARMIQTPAKDIAVQIAKHLSGGVNRFDIRITPPELGRIEVRLEIAESGKVSAHLVADKPETLDLLQKDRATLEKALAEAGLDADGSSLEFSMREGKDENEKNFSNLGMEVADDASDGQGTLHLQEQADLEVSAYGFDIVRMKRLDISI